MAVMMKVFCDGDCDGDCTSPKLVATGAKCQLVLAVMVGALFCGL